MFLDVFFYSISLSGPFLESRNNVKVCWYHDTVCNYDDAEDYERKIMHWTYRHCNCGHVRNAMWIYIKWSPSALYVIIIPIIQFFPK
jgi:hypothetical protein